MLERLLRSDDIKARVKSLLRAVGYDYGHWTRTVMHRECTRRLLEIGISQKDALEISAGPYWRTLGFRSFTEANYPEFDICSDRLGKQFDIVIADQVFEHLLWPYRAARNVLAMLRPGGWFLISTPFLIRVHAIPHDCSRWTPLGMKHFLAECGFPLENIETGAWGNRACVKANFSRWARRGWFRSLRNEPDFPVTVWAFAQRPASSEHASTSAYRSEVASVVLPKTEGT